MEKPLPNEEIAQTILLSKNRLFAEFRQGEITSEEYYDGMGTIGAEEKQWEISLFDQRKDSTEP